ASVQVQSGPPKREGLDGHGEIVQDADGSVKRRGMKRRTKFAGLRGIAREFGLIARRGRQVWRLGSWRHRLALGGALLIMSLASMSNTAVAVGVGQLIDGVNPGKHPGQTPEALMQVARRWLVFIGGVYLVREAMNVLRRYLVENTCTRIDKDTYV